MAPKKIPAKAKKAVAAKQSTKAAAVKEKRKKPIEKRTRNTARYRGRTVYGYVYGNDITEWSVKQIIDVNPLAMASKGQDPLLKTNTEMWSRYTIDSISADVIPVAGRNAACGSTLVLGLWDNPSDAKGPKSHNTALHTLSKTIALGDRGEIRFPRPSFPREYTIDIEGDQNEARPYFLFAGVAGPTTRVYAAAPQTGGDFYTGSLWQVVLNYEYTFYGPKDASTRGRLLDFALEGVKGSLVEVIGSPAIITLSGDTPAFMSLMSELRREYEYAQQNGNTRGVWKWLKKACLALVGWAQAIAPVLPEPWGVIVGGGAFMVGGIMELTPDGVRVQKLSMQIFKSLGDQIIDLPLPSTDTRTTELYLGPGSNLRQINHPDESTTIPLSPFIKPDPGLSRYETFGSMVVRPWTQTYITFLPSTASGGTAYYVVTGSGGQPRLMGGPFNSQPNPDTIWTLNKWVWPNVPGASGMSSDDILVELSTDLGLPPVARGTLSAFCDVNTAIRYRQGGDHDKEGVVYNMTQAVQLMLPGQANYGWIIDSGQPKWVAPTPGPPFSYGACLIVSKTSKAGEKYSWNYQPNNSATDRMLMPMTWQVRTNPFTVMDVINEDQEPLELESMSLTCSHCASEQ
uniref:Capsid protein n=1 Tax=Wenling rattails astrovirus 3 TaxID=2116137 RepID=A0A2P1GNC9_9VIRU|nr:capsid protein [Wenling rattails astrovirus 3]